MSAPALLVVGMLLAADPLNEAPTDILLDNNILAENLPAGTSVGKLDLVDAEDTAAPVLPGLGAAQAGTAVWTQATGGRVLSSPAVDTSGRVFVGSYDGKVHALDATTGQQGWSFETQGNVHSSPAVGADGTVYVGSEEGKLYALNGATGQSLWQYQTGEWLSSSPAVGPDGTVYVGSEDGKLYALDGTTGAKVWEFAAGNRIYNSPAVSGDGVVYVGTVSLGMSGIVRANVFGGSAAGIFGTPPGMGGSVVVDGIGTNIFTTGRPWGNGRANRLEMHGQSFNISENTSFAVSRLFYYNGTTYTSSTVDTVPFDLSLSYTDPFTETIDFSFTFNLQYTPNNGVSDEEDADILTISDIASSTVFQVDGEDFTLSLVGFSTDGGNTIQNQYTLYEDAETESLLYANIAKPAVYKLYAIDGTSGEKLWEFQTGDEIYGSPAIGPDGTVYFGSDDRFVYALNGTTGQLRWSYQAGNEVKSSPAIGEDGTVYIGSNDNRLYALDGQTGDKLWDFAAGDDILSSPAVDAAGTVYVGANDGKLYALDGQTGEKTWEYSTGAAVHSSPLLGMNGMLYVGSDDQNVHAVHAGARPADSNWPQFRQNHLRNGRVGGQSAYVAFELVAGEGDTDNAYFQVSGDELQLARLLNYEAQETYSLRLRGTDTGGAHVEKVFTVHAVDAPDIPSPVLLSNAVVAENESKNTVVGNLAAQDEDADERHTFKLVAPTGGAPTDNAQFKLSGNVLKTNAIFDFETKSAYTIHVQATDKDKLTFLQELAIGISDANDAPTGLSLAPSSVDENLAKGTVLGKLSGIDPDTGDTHTFKISGGKDKSKFKLSGTDLLTKAVFDHEDLDELEVDILVTDAARATYLASLTIPVNDLNDAPTDLLLDNADIAENQPAGTAVGAFTLVDPDEAASGATFALVAGEGDANNSSFTIADAQLSTAAVFDFETQANLNIRVRGTDSGGLTFEQAYAIQVINGPDAPTGITLDNASVEENLKKGTTVGNLAAIDPDAGEKHTFKLFYRADGSSSDNALFKISGTRLTTNVTFDFEDRSSYVVHVEVTDRNKLTFAQDLPVTVLDANDAPTAVTLGPPVIDENQPKGTEIGTLQATDADAQDAHTFKITGGKDKSLFRVKGDKLTTNLIFNYEDKATFEVEVTATDSAKATAETTFTIQVNDLNDTPSDLQLDNDTLAENLPAGTSVGTFSLTDEDADVPDNTYALVAGGGDADNATFAIVDGTLELAVPLDYETQDEYSIRVKGTDADGASIEKTFTIEATDVNEPPSAILLSADTVSEDAPVATLVGKVTGTDPEGDKLTFALATDHDTLDNELFTLSKGNLSTAGLLDADTRSILTVRVEASDGTNRFTQDFAINVTNINEAPPAPTLTPSALAENLPAGTVVGILSTTDPDPGDSFEFRLATGTGDTDNARFSVDQATGQVTVLETFDFETTPRFNIRTAVKDSGGLETEAALIIVVTNANDAPTALTLNPDLATVLEGEAVGAAVGDLAVADVDTGESWESHTFSLVSGIGAEHNSQFQIVGIKLQTSAVLASKFTPVANVRIRATDSGGESVEAAFNITVEDRNDTPSDILLSPGSLQENLPAGTLAGTLAAVDADPADTHIFALVGGSGDAGNDAFTIRNGNEVVAKDPFDFETQSSYSLRVSASDSQGATLEKVLSIEVLDEAVEEVRHRLQVNRIPSSGGLAAGAGLHLDGTTVDLNAQAEDGYLFTGWTGDIPAGASASDESLSITMDGDKTLTAYFARMFYPVKVLATPERHGYVSGGGSVLSGTTLTLTATELAEPHTVPFKLWRVNGVDQPVDADNPTSLTLVVEEPLTVEAVFDFDLPDTMKLVAPGIFTMGDDDSRNGAMKPAHEVAVSAFYVDQYEVTKKLWNQVRDWAVTRPDGGEPYRFSYDPGAAIGRNRPHVDPGYLEDFPMSGMNWEDMLKWCNARSEMEGRDPVYYLDASHSEVYRTGDRRTGIEMQNTFVDWRARGFRMPTEAEWEKAARGGVSGLTYPHGDTATAADVFYDQPVGPFAAITSVGSYTPNSYGLYDMAGNAWEACWDWFWDDWYKQPESLLADPLGPDAQQVSTDGKTYRVVRGGAGDSDDDHLAVAYRNDINKTWTQYAIALRPVVSAPSASEADLVVKVDPGYLGSAIGSGTYPLGDTATVTSLGLEEGVSFLRWVDAGGNELGTGTSMDLVLDSNMEVTAVLEDARNLPVQNHSLQTLVDTPGTGTVTGGGVYLGGTEVTLVATPATGLDFIGWSGDVVGTTSPATLTLNSDKVVIAYFGDASVDTDGDGLSNSYEFVLGSDPHRKDTDGEGLEDGVEVNTYGSDPTLTDSDGDSHDDKTEVDQGSDPLDPVDTPFFMEVGLELYYDFKGNADDESANGHNGRARDVSYVKDRNLTSKGAGEFNGSKSNVSVSYSGPLGSNARTVSGWVLAETGAEGGLVSWGKDSNTFEINIVSGAIQVVADDNTLAGTTDLLDGMWHQFIVAVPEGGGLDDAGIYIDGVAEATQASGTTSDPLSTVDGRKFYVGTSSAGSFKGTLDEIRLWTRSLSAGNAAAHYQIELPRPPPQKPKVTGQPVSANVAVDGAVTFTVAAFGIPTPTYQWEKMDGRTGVAIAGATGTSLTISNASLADSGTYRCLATNVRGTVRSKTAKLQVLTVPAITRQLGDSLLLEGGTAYFQALENPAAIPPNKLGKSAKIYMAVTGSPKFTYQWHKDGMPIAKAVKNKLGLKKVTAAKDDGVYKVDVRNLVGEVTSQEFNVNVIGGVQVDANPVDTGSVVGSNASVTVNASGAGTLTYQWQKKNGRVWEDVPGATAATLSFPSYATDKLGDYRCAVGNGATVVYSKDATIETHVAPSISNQPQGGNFAAGVSHTFSVVATGYPAPSYQWQKLGTDGTTWEDISKATKPDLRYSRLLKTNAGKYRVVATSVAGNITSDEVDLVVYYAPKYTTNLVSQSVNEGADATFTVAAEMLDSNGSTPATYTWYKDKVKLDAGGPVSGVTTSSLTITGASAADGGSYYCEIKNGIGTTKSALAKLTIILKPFASKALRSLSLAEGKNATFSASIKGSKPLTYVWKKDGVLLDSQVKNQLKLVGVAAADAGNYTVDVSNPAGSLTLSADLAVIASALLLPADSVSLDLQSATADLDQDGQPDLLEHALGSNPASSGSTYRPEADTVEDGEGRTYVSFTYTESNAATDVTYIVEHSSDLLTWDPVDLTTASVDRLGRGAVTQVTVHVPASQSSGFFRVRVEK